MEELKSAVINAVQQEIWAIKPEYLDRIHEVLYMKFFSGKTASERVAEAEAALGRELNNKQENHDTSGNVAVINVRGTISKRMNMFTEISGGASTEMIQKSIQSAIDNPHIDAIVLNIDSPGGTVSGTQALADYIYGVRDIKPIVAHVDGLMASAAYWIGSSASKITVAEGTSQIGSIGVVTAHYDYSKAMEDAGVKKTYIYSGKYKAMGNEAEPLNKEAKSYIQAQLDGIYTIFIDSVARNRGVSSDEVLTKMADARVFLAQDAIDAGLVDEFMTLEGTIKMAADMVSGSSKNSRRNNKEVSMDKKTELEITPGKEEKIMEEKIKELEAKVALLEADVKAKNVEIAELSAANTKLDKELILERAKVQKEKDSAEAEAIAIAALATSSIPQNLHTKVRGLVNYADFKKEDGTFDKDAYAAAFKAEVAEWEGSFTKSTTVVLTDDTKIDSIGSESADDDVEYGKKLAKEFAGHIRSEE